MKDTVDESLLPAECTEGSKAWIDLMASQYFVALRDPGETGGAWRYLVDISAAARAHLSPVRERLVVLADNDLLVGCSIVDLEVEYSARYRRADNFLSPTSAINM